MKSVPNELSTETLSEQLEAANRRVLELEAALRQSQALHGQAQQTLLHLQASYGWKLLQRCGRLQERWLPPGSRRRRAWSLLFRCSLQLRQAWQRRFRLPGFASINRDYLRWIARHEPGKEELERQRRVKFSKQPLFSILVCSDGAGRPAGLEDSPRGLAVESVFNQTYGNWELCVTGAQGLVGESRCRVVPLPEDAGIVATVNAALESARGDFVALLDPPDSLAPFALFEIVQYLQDHPDADVIYSDEDEIVDGRRLNPHFKPGWSPETLRSHPYLGRLVVFRRELLQRVGGYRPGFDGAEDYDLVLRATEAGRRIHHIPRVLYHRRDGQSEIEPLAAQRAVREHLQRCGVDGEVHDGIVPGAQRVAYALKDRPLVSIIIPNRDQPRMLRRCVDSILRTVYEQRELLIVENHSRETETFACYRQFEPLPGVRILHWTEPFNYAAVNNFAAAQARGEVLLFLNNDVEAIRPDWLERLLEHALRPEVGAVGAKLYFPDERIQHAGIVLGVSGSAGHAFVHCRRSSPGYGRRLAVVQNVSAVTGACLMMRREIFEEMGGFDERFVIAFNDLDLCLKVRQRGYAVIWTPHAELYHHECATRGQYFEDESKRARHKAEEAEFLKRWGGVIAAGDPYYNPNLTPLDGSFGLRT